ncbi:FecR family protein [Flavivirga algicola]|uniref:FecR family protein n=1 Tax=Flavivirga algicola TaxID=2729136 RepID=A0ABX1RTK4_9FLAO|nr:FecR domain-containing protein [Flavivirga algicola]NMH86877.1 FecR family protein [Flavivirga algicola]
MDINKLIFKKLNNKLSVKEAIVFNNWYKHQENKELYVRLKELKASGEDISVLINLDANTAWDQVLKSYESRRINKSKSANVIRPMLRYAAVFLALVTISYGSYRYIFIGSQNKEIDPTAITLQLDDGKVIVINSNDTESITDNKGNILGLKEGSKLNYKDTGVEEKLIYNTLVIPYGKRFEIALSDGTLVHLNAGSSLKYPVKFLNGKKRKVYLEGEAFFDVSKDKEHPFIVNTSNMDVRVLGTRFNVSAFPEDKTISTVLVEGAVNLSSISGDKVLELKPNYKAEWDITNSETQIKRVDTDIYTSWINGRLVLKNLPFKNIVKKLERHYNVEIINNYEALNNQVFTASFDIETIEEVLNSFADNKPFVFNINNKTITITKT